MNDEQNCSPVHFYKLIVGEFTEGTKENHPYQNAEDYYNQDLVFSEVPEQIPQQKIVNRAEAEENDNDKL